MRKRNSIKQLNKTASHRKAMMRNMVTSLFEHERITTTRARSRVLKPYAEKLITRAKRNLKTGVSPETMLHNKREVLKHIKDRNVVIKLFEDIAPRFIEKNGGYTRIIHLQERQSDSAKMSIIELVDRKVKEQVDRTEKEVKKPVVKDKKQTKKVKEEEKKKDKESKKQDKDQKEKKRRKWFWGFQRKKGEEH